MEKAKAAVGNFLNKDGKHDTTVHETVNPAVQNEHIHKTRHENVTTAVDREVHQDHHHTSVQPVHDREVLPEQHSHNMAGVEHRQFQHGNDAHVKERLAAEQAQFKDSRTVHDTQHSQSVNPTVAGEHVHHHVHEHIQPVVHKETVAPSVVHTTIPVHEVHQNEAKHHAATQLPAVSMAQFKDGGGSLDGREVRRDHFDGEPRSVGGTLGGQDSRGTTGLTNEGVGHHGHHGHHNTTTGNNTTTGTGVGSTHDTATHTKPSLMDKLNPKKDADGDGKAGFMK